MPYTKTDWIEGVTPVNPTNLNKIEQGIDDAHLHISQTNNPHATSSEQINKIANIEDASTSGNDLPIGVSNFAVFEGSIGYPDVYGTVLTVKNTDIRCFQIFTHHSSNRMWTRVWYDTSGWTNWTEIWHGGNSSALIEYGSNANGEYFRWSDGLQICLSTWSEAITTSAAGNVHRHLVDSRNFPASFTGINAASVDAGSANIWCSIAAANTAYSATIWSHTTLGNTSTTMKMMAIGRWK